MVYRMGCIKACVCINYEKCGNSGRRRLATGKIFEVPRPLPCTHLFQIMPNDSHLPPQPLGTSKHIMIIPCKTTRRKLKRKVKAYSTCCSQAVTHPSTWQAQHCLTSVIGREPVYSVWYGRRQWSLLVVYFYVGFHLSYKCITYSLVLLIPLVEAR